MVTFIFFQYYDISYISCCSVTYDVPSMLSKEYEVVLGGIKLRERTDTRLNSEDVSAKIGISAAG